MTRDFFLRLLVSLAAEPMQAEWSARPAAARAAPPVVAGPARCAAEAGPALAARAAGERWRGASSAVGVRLGVRAGMAVAAGATPGWTAEAAQPSLTGSGS